MRCSFDQNCKEIYIYSILNSISLYVTNIFDEYFLQCMNFMSTVIFMLFTSSLFFFSRSNFEMRLVHDTFVPLFRTR